MSLLTAARVRQSFERISLRLSGSQGRKERIDIAVVSGERIAQDDIVDESSFGFPHFTVM